MGYLHIPNLYRQEGQTILLFKECYALCKIHGTSAHITFLRENGQPTVHFFSGGTKHETFVKLFEVEKLMEAFKNLGLPIDKSLSIFGESYGGKEQGMSQTYGTVAKFVAFDVKIGECWLNVPEAEKIAKDFGLEFVHYVKISTDLKEIDAQRDACSVQAVRNGVTTPEDFMAGKGKMREGVVLRPLIEVTLNNGSRVIAKHKRAEFMETKTERPIVDPAQMKILSDANAVADEWVTANRLSHVLQKIPDHGMEKMREILAAMLEDVLREGAGEIQDSKEVRKAITTKTSKMYRDFLQSQLHASYEKTS